MSKVILTFRSPWRLNCRIGNPIPYCGQLSHIPMAPDMDSDGYPEGMTWTKGGVENNFLWLDLNGNRTVDNGSELFGNGTLLMSGDYAENGFDALKEYDNNKDGVIDSRDPVWRDLQLWCDRNHSGLSDSDEITPLRRSAVVAIDLDYKIVPRKDKYGNQFRFKSHVTLRRPNGKTKVEPVFDIIFVAVDR